MFCYDDSIENNTEDQSEKYMEKKVIIGLISCRKNCWRKKKIEYSF